MTSISGGTLAFLPVPHPPRPPNILIVIADDHRADAIAALGHPAVRTPVMDELVRTGTAFTRMRIMGGLMAAVCAPSRACLLTGLNPYQADAAPALERGPEYKVRLPTTACTLPEHFRAAGYETFLTGKWHNDTASLLRSFDVGRNIFPGGMCHHTAMHARDLAAVRSGAPERPVPGFSTEIFCRTAETFIRERSRTRPFFAYVALTSPHDPRTPPPEFRAPYAAAGLPLPPNFLGEHPFDNGELGIRDELLAPKPLAPGIVREHLADYYGMISHQDAWIGRVLRALRDTGEEDNTIVVYLSDHGLALGSHGLLGKQNLYEHSIRVPFILRGPGVPRNVQRATPAYSLDLYATLCELAGLAAPAGLESRSLVPALASAAAPSRDYFFSAYMDVQRMATDDRWKLILYHVNGVERAQLFDLAADPDERHDLAGAPEHAAHAARLRQQLARWQRQVGDRWWQPAGEASSRAP